MKSEDLIESLWDHLVAHPDGTTKPEMAAALSVSKRKISDVIKTFRVYFGDDTINLVSVPQGFGESHLYRLVGTTDEAREWVSMSWKHVEARLVTVIAVVRAFVNGSDGRTIDGRLARVWLRHFTRALEDIEDLQPAGPSQMTLNEAELG